MASIGHIAVGMAAGRLWAPRGASTRQLAKSMAAFSLLSVLPDADAIAFKFGIPYEAPFGHRGATHSIFFALLVGGVAFFAARPLGFDRVRTGLFAFFVVLSHPLLDMCTTKGGYGCEIFFPVSTERFDFPISVIPIAPIGLAMFSLRGFLVIVVEALEFLPVFIYATFPRRQRAT